MRQAARQASPRQAGPAAISGPTAFAAAAAVDGFIPFALRCARGPQTEGRTTQRETAGPSLLCGHGTRQAAYEDVISRPI